MNTAGRGQAGAVRPVRGQQSVLDLIKSAKLHKRPRLISTGVLWVFGLLAMFVLPAPVSVTPEAMNRFVEKHQEMEKEAPQRAAAAYRLMEAQLSVADAKSWFWWLNSEQRVVVKERQREEAAAAKVVAKLQKNQAVLISQAKAELGLWSEAGVEEGRGLFWGAFQRGKVFGRQQTLWDAILNLFVMQDRNLVGAVIQLICSAVVNFSIGMVISIFVFVFQLPSLLMSFQAGILSGTAFFFVACIGACSVVAGFVLLLWGAGAGAVYTVATLGGPARLGTTRGSARHYPRHLHAQ